MKTNFAYIEAAAAEALTQQLEMPVVPAIARQRASESSLKVIAGFPVRDDAQEQSEMDSSRSERRANISLYRRHRDEVAAELNKLGITPLAIVPKSAWERICSRSGLFRLEPDGNGEVDVSKSLIDDFEKRADELLYFSIPITAMLVATIASCLSFIFAFDWSSWGIGLATLVAFWVSFTFTRALLISDDSAPGRPGWKHIAWRKKLVRLFIWRFCKRPWEQVLKEFFPDGVSQSGKLKAHLVLPEPPTDVVATLLKAKSLKLKVAAVAEAISFTETPVKILRRAHDDVIAERKPVGYRGYASYEEWLEKCPIIYHEHRSAIAVIAQFGNFPVEQRVVDEVINSEHLI